MRFCLGPYEIEALLGTGGRGEVYKANDTGLHRTVVIKALPEGVASDPSLKQRFEREARAVVQLSHPHICALHDIGSQEPSTPSAGSRTPSGSGQAIDFLVK